MPIFSPRPSLANSAALGNIQATVNPAPQSVNSTTGMATYNIEIAGNMTELVQSGVNNISVVAQATTAYSTTPITNISALNTAINNSMPLAQTSMSSQLVSIDPKETVAHGILADISSGQGMVDVTQQSVQTGLQQTQVVYNEVPFNDRLNRSGIDIEAALSGDLNFDFGRHALINTDRLLNGISPHGPSLTTETYRPTINQVSTNVIPEQTIKNLAVQIPIGSIPSVQIQNDIGTVVGIVGSDAINVATPRLVPSEIRHLAFFAEAALNKKIINISFSKKNNLNFIHVNSPTSRGITGYTIHVRKLSKTPKFDRYTDMGTFSKKHAENLPFHFDITKKHMIHVIPMSGNEPLCYSATATIGGIVDEYDCSYTCYQRSAGSLEFPISNIPIDIKKIFAVRTNDLSGETTKLNDVQTRKPNQILSDKTVHATPESLVYRDPTIPQTNSLLSYDFFGVNKFGIQKHLFRTTKKIYEKDTQGIIFKDAKLSRNELDEHVLSFVIKYPDPFQPQNKSYSLVNPDDDFIEACRNLKRVCVLSIKRHGSDGYTEDLGTHILNDGELNTLKAEINDTGDFVVRLTISRDFLRGQGIDTYTNPNLEFRYEIRGGSYLLSNELSLLSNPLKIFVPNEFTDGKTSYSFHPIVHDAPSRKDRGLHGRLGSTRKDLMEVALTSSSRILVTDERTVVSSGKKTLKASLVPLNSGQTQHAIKITGTLESNFETKFDHAELLVGDSTTGEYVSLGKHRIMTSDFYFLDTKSVKLACNKLKYKLVVRSIGFVNEYDLVSNVVDIGVTNTNVIRSAISDTSPIASNLATGHIIGGLR